MHKLLLRLYPRSFRNEYGEELRRVFAQRRRETTSVFGMALLWLEEIADTLGSAARVHADILRQDLRHTRRALTRSRGFTVAAILVTALGVGATTAAFSVADHVLLRPLPFADPERLVKMWESTPEYGRMDVSPANYRDWKSAATSFSMMGAYDEGSTANLVGSGEPVRLDGSGVTADLLTVFGVRPQRGRLFTEADDQPNSPVVVVISDAAWRKHFGADPSIIGRSIRLDDELCTVVGVMPASFQFPSRTTSYWMPQRFGQGAFENRNSNFLRIIARLKPGVPREQARAEMNAISVQLERQYPKDNAKVGTALIDFRDEVGRQPRMLLYTLVGAAICVLLIACTNLASLLIARASARDRELALRTALGAGRERLVRQLITESCVIALAGGALGVLLAVSVVPMIVRLVPTSLPIAEAPHADVRMLLTALFVTIASGIGFGVFPALRAARQSASLRDGVRAGTSRRTERVRAVLVAAQVAVSVVLLVSAGLLVRALLRVQNVDPGFKSERVLTMRTTLPMPKYGPVAARTSFYQRVLEDVRAVPGVTGAAYTSWLPIAFRGGIWPVFVPGETGDENSAPRALVRFASADLFSVLNVPLKAGRSFNDSDTITAEPVVVVSESFVNAHWPGQDARGKHFKISSRERTVVGVVGDVRVRGLERESEPQVYLPYQQQPDFSGVFYFPKDLAIGLADESRSGEVARQVRAIVAKTDPELPVTDVRLMSAIVAGESVARETQLWVVGAFAAVACLLAAVGLHGLLAFVVSSRSREIGVRLALGAEPRQVLALVSRRGLTLAVIGAAVGTVLAYLVARSMQSLLAGVNPADAVSMVGAAALSLASAAVGTLLPALRAARTSPTEALRAD